MVYCYSSPPKFPIRASKNQPKANKSNKKWLIFGYKISHFWEMQM
jgi:hypothetical protein